MTREELIEKARKLKIDVDMRWSFDTLLRKIEEREVLVAENRKREEEIAKKANDRKSLLESIANERGTLEEFAAISYNDLPKGKEKLWELAHNVSGRKKQADKAIQKFQNSIQDGSLYITLTWSGDVFQSAASEKVCDHVTHWFNTGVPEEEIYNAILNRLVEASSSVGNRSTNVFSNVLSYMEVNEWADVARIVRTDWN